MGGLFSFGLYHFIVYGFDPSMSVDKIKKFINNNFKFSYYSIQKLQNPNYVLFSFDDENICEVAAEKLYRYRFGNSRFIIVQVINGFEDAIQRLDQKIKSYSVLLTNEENLDNDKNYIVPNIDIDYFEQCSIKSLQTTQQIHDKFSNTFCEVSVIKPDKTIFFWNKGYFDIGYDREGKLSIGFSSGSKNNTFIIPLTTKQIYFAPIYSAIKSFLSFIEKSDLPPYEQQTKEGVWKSIYVQVSNDNNNCLLTIEINEELSDKIKKQLILSLKNIPSIILKYKEEYMTIKGTGYINENIDSISFQITPQIYNYWPLNSTTFYKYIGALLYLFENEHENTLIEVYSKISITSLCLSKYVEKVISIENDSNCISYAEQICLLNSIKNIEFKNKGKIIDLVDEALKQSDKEKCIVIVDLIKSLTLKKTLLKILENLPQYIILTNESISLPNEISLFLKEYFIESCFIIDYYPHTNKNFYVTVLKKLANSSK